MCSGVIGDHLLQRRLKIAKWLMEVLQPGGLLFLTAFGRDDSEYSNGEQVEQHTFCHTLGFPVHYFDQPELKSLFPAMEILYFCTKLKQDLYPRPHLHDTHILLARKPS